MKDKEPELTMLDTLDAFKQLEEMARGYREHLEQNGWNETMAEMIAAHMLIEFQKKAIGV